MRYRGVWDEGPGEAHLTSFSGLCPPTILRSSPGPGNPHPQSRKAEDLAVETGPERMDEAAAGKVLDDLRGFLVKEPAQKCSARVKCGRPVSIVWWTSLSSGKGAIPNSRSLTGPP